VKCLRKTGLSFCNACRPLHQSDETETIGSAHRKCMLSQIAKSNPIFLPARLRYCTTSSFLLILFHRLGSRPSLHLSLRKAQPVLSVINYRPISLTCVASKIMECIIAKQVYVHFLENNLLSSAQHGFVKDRSIFTNLFDAVNNWTLTVQNKKRSLLHT